MPAVPRSPQSKRGTPKAKGAIRAKSGCYTCRIRRKKCDEQQSADTGSCQTCVRLKLECLGFGAKRPEWLREARNVTEVREKIKNFLASQGMIKGHSGNAPSRSSEPESSHLRLGGERGEDSFSDSSSGSPPTPTLSLSHDSASPYRHHTSSMRDEPFWAGQAYNTQGLHYSGLQRDNSPYSQDSVHDQFNYQSSDNTLVPAASYAIRSTYGPLYHWNPQDEIDWHWLPQIAPGYQFNLQPQTTLPSSVVNSMVDTYMSRVVHAQYLLAHVGVPDMIFETVHQHEPTRRAVEMLTTVYDRRFRQPRMLAIEASELNDRLKQLEPLLSNEHLSAEDAMAALHVVSTFLFDGGQGNWRAWLTTASRYVRSILTSTQYCSAMEALSTCPPKDAFIIKTTLWFDVLASITTGEAPYFLNSIREMFDPNVSRVQDPSYELQYSMMSPMGCENRVVWALAEISHLATYKHEQEARGCLSITSLVKYAESIDTHLNPPAYRFESPETLTGRCQLASEVFRTSARLYLRSVVSGDYPHVPEIKEGVQEVIHSIQHVNRATTNIGGENVTSRSVTRNTVFGFYIAGALANRGSREIIHDHLQRENQDFGNCGSILNLLEDIWRRRDATSAKVPVPWRGELNRTSTLLV